MYNPFGNPGAELVRRIVLSGTINEEMATQFVQESSFYEFLEPTKNLTIFLSTFGGEALSALQIYDCEKSCQCPLTCIGTGKVMSAGVLILAASDKGYRFLTRNCRVMVHSVSAGFAGSLSSLNEEMDEINKTQETFCELLAYESGQSVKNIKKLLEGNKYMSAEEAIKNGFADRIVPFKKVPQKPNVPKKPRKLRVKKPKKTK